MLERLVDEQPQVMAGIGVPSQLEAEKVARALGETVVQQPDVHEGGTVVVAPRWAYDQAVEAFAYMPKVTDQDVEVPTSEGEPTEALAPPQESDVKSFGGSSGKAESYIEEVQRRWRSAEERAALRRPP